MKRFFCVFICLLLTITFVACGEKDTVSDEFKILELAEKQLLDDMDFKVIDGEGTVWLENQDIEKVLVTYQKEKNRYLELRLTDEGLKDFKKALKNKDTVLTITVNGEKLASPVILDDIEENSAIVLGEYEDVMNWFNTIT
ncbi:MAG: hypothetical protein IJY79_07040 [Clostridia bacterium]|nr:hypothetical protein [Clostridia bacterium]